MKGSLTTIRPDDLTAQVVEAVFAKVPQLDRNLVEDLVLGCGQPAGESGVNLARVVAVLADMPNVPGVTINRYCSSSLQAIRMSAHAIKAGEGDIFLAAGVETVSRFINGMADDGPANERFNDARARTAARQAGDQGAWTPPVGLPDVYMGMGDTAENVAEIENVSREDQDAFAARSQQLATENLESGFWEAEITPVTLPDGTVVAKDDGIHACPLNDGAAAVIVMSDTKAKELGLTPLARIVASGVSGLNPEIMGLGPVEACRQALGRAGMTIDNVDLVEINEAFAAQVLPSARHLGIPLEKLNTRGGGIALGHPFGMTGARIMTTLIHNLQESDKTIGMETMCVGGGQGMSMIIERL